MGAIIKRELKSFMKNPVYWVGLLLVIAGVFGQLKPYLSIRYLKSDGEIHRTDGDLLTQLTDGDVGEGIIPAPEEKRRENFEEWLSHSLTEDAGIASEEAAVIMKEVRKREIGEACRYLEETCGYFGAKHMYDDAFCYYQGSFEEVNAYLDEKLGERRYSWYFARKFADFGGLYLCFFASVLLAFLFMQDTRRSMYELLHTKPVRASEYVLGKVGGGFLAMAAAAGILDLVFYALCLWYHAGEAGIIVNPLDFLLATCMYILPNMLMIVCVYALIAVVFKNPLPAFPLLMLYIVYSNMGSRNAEGMYGYYGRPLAIMVRFVGRFFEADPPPIAAASQIGLLGASAAICFVVTAVWKRRRVY